MGTPSCLTIALGGIRLTLAALLVCGVPAARASQSSWVHGFRNLGFVQTADGNELVSIGVFDPASFNATMAAISYQDFPSETSTPFHLRPEFSGRGDDAYPVLDFSSVAPNLTTADTARVDYLADDYAQSYPYLTRVNDSTLAGMDPEQLFTYYFNPDEKGTDGVEPEIYFTIFDVTASRIVYTVGFPPAAIAATSVYAGHYSYVDPFSREGALPSSRDLVGCDGCPTIVRDLRP